jgi:uncharacterized phage protein (TIGR01671 family)
MREIKLRAWNKRDWWMDPEFWIGEDGLTWETSARRYDTPNKEIDRTDDLIVMLATCVTDKNGTEIYEGDILDIKGELSAVEWIGSGFKVLRNHFFKADEHAPIVRSYVTLDVLNLKEAVIVGNIYENPDLLNQ